MSEILGLNTTPNVINWESLNSFSKKFNSDTVAGLHNSHLRCKDITSYYNDGSLWNRINGTNGYSVFEDLWLGDYFSMSRPISAYERTGQHQVTGSQYVTIAGFDIERGNGNAGGAGVLTSHHLFMIPGAGCGGRQHFGRSRMNSTNVTTGGYKGSEMHTTAIGAVASSGSTSSTASINQQLYAEFKTHLITHKAMVSNSVNNTAYNRFGTNTGASRDFEWVDVQARLLTEIEAYGSIVWSSSGYDIGEGNIQLPLFAMNKYALNNQSAYWWLRAVASSSCFCYCGGTGLSGYADAIDAELDVRPGFLIN